MTITPGQRAQQAKATHRRQTRRGIWLPFLAGILLLFILMIIAVLSPRPGVMADFLLTTLLLCPALLCLFPIYVGMVALVGGMGRLNQLARRPLYTLDEKSGELVERVYSASDAIARRTINISARLSPFEKWAMRLFNTSEERNREQPTDR
ncbi:MAG: hypothetical protein SNJ59_01585 [Aggregatilineales bacterium]